jgi:ectoine hydroxylase-related dioxygenase (phytanoyl-CoA dioxygenase family)
MKIYILFVIVLVVSSLFTVDVLTTKPYSLKRDGCCLLKNVLSKEDINILIQNCKHSHYKQAKEYVIAHKSILKRIQKYVSTDYNFQDYIVIIQKSAIHTCHRDYNGSLFNEGQKHPSYTVLIYLEEMEKCLGVIPKSHKSKYSYSLNLTNKVEHVVCKKGDVLLFDANLIHVGALNEKEDNVRIQMKITHKDDIDVLDYYEEYNKVLNEPNHLPKQIVKLQRDLSCMFPYISTLTQTDAMKQSAKNTQGSISKLFSYVFYGNSEFYNLKNAF